MSGVSQQYAKRMCEQNEILTLILLTWRIWCAPNRARKWQMGFNLVFKGLMKLMSNVPRTG